MGTASRHQNASACVESSVSESLQCKLTASARTMNWVRIYRTLLYFILISFCLVTCTELKVGVMLPFQPDSPGLPALPTSGGALLLGVAEAHRRNPGVNVSIVWKTSARTCDETYALIYAFELVQGESVDVIIGPTCWQSLRIISKFIPRLELSLSHQVPLVTWLPGDRHDLYPNATAITTYGDYQFISDTIATVLQDHSWTNLGIISSRTEICDSILQFVNDKFPNKDFNIRRFAKIEHYTNESYVTALTEVKDKARIILLCLPYQFLRDFFLKVDELGLTSGKYAFVYCRFGPYAGRGLDGFPGKGQRDRVLSVLLQIGAFQMNETTFAHFSKAATSQSTAGYNITQCCDPPDEYALTLYETVISVVQTFVRATSTYHGSMAGNISVSGNMTSSLYGGTIVTDANGRIEAPMYVAHYQDGQFQKWRVGKTYRGRKEIKWPNGGLPTDHPVCGWDGSQCDSSESDSAGVIAGSVVAGVIGLIAFVVVAFIYRKFRFEKELLSMVWKVNSNEIRRPRTHTQGSVRGAKRKLKRVETRGTLGLGSTSSLDRNLLYAPIGSYKGSIVAVKNIQRRSIHLTRDALKDLKTLRELQHENLNPFVGANLEPENSYILTKYCAKGSLQDVLENDDIKLDHMFQLSFSMDMARGLDFLHRSPIRSHGNLKSTNCVIDSRWVLKLTDFGAIVANVDEEPSNQDEENQFYSKLLWTAPELLRMHRRPAKGTQKGDVYSFAIIEHEILTRCPPFFYNNAPSSKVIINRVRNCEDPAYRPRTPEEEVPEKLLTLMLGCWQENSELRPDMHNIHKRLIDINGGRKINIMDNMITMLESYSNHLEELVANRTQELAHEKQKTDRLLYQMLPPSVAEQLKFGHHVRPETYDEVSLFFSDIVGFTTISGNSEPLEVVDLLNDLYTTFDGIIGMHDVYKVETIGDAYMCASGIPRRNGKRHSGEIASMALDLLSAVTSFKIRHMPGVKLQLRIGLHTGACAAGVVGLTMPRYCLFGDTINMASRMESTGRAFSIHVSLDMKTALDDLDWGFTLVERGVIEVKGKGLQKTYWLVGKRDFNKPLPEEVEKLRREYEEAEASGRPLSPTESHISSGSQPENASMYGNIFRKASIALTFLQSISGDTHISSSNTVTSPTGSELTVKDGQCLCNELKIPGERVGGAKVKKRHSEGHSSEGKTTDAKHSVWKDVSSKLLQKSDSHKAKKMKIPKIEIS